MMRPDKNFVAQQADRLYDLLRQRAAVDRDDLEYLAEKIEKLKDERLKSIIAELIGWTDDDRAEIETFVAIAIEVLRKTNLSKIRACTAIVEARYWQQEMKREQQN